MTAARIDPDELNPSNPDGKATSVPDFYLGVIAAINEHADELDSGAEGASLLYNVKGSSFNAKGDGVSDDTLPITNAIAAAAAGGGGTVYFPNGTYIVSQTVAGKCLVVGSNINLIGESREGAVLKMAANQPVSTRMIYCGPSANDIIISNLTLDGNKDNNPDNDNEHANGVFLDTTNRVLVDYVTVQNFPGSGIVPWSGSISTIVSNCYVSNCDWNGIVWGDAGGEQLSICLNCYVTGCVSGIHIELSGTTPNTAGILFDHCYTDSRNGGTSAALEIAGAAGVANFPQVVTVRACQVQGMLTVTQALGVTVEGCQINFNDTGGNLNAVQIFGAASDVWFKNNVITVGAAAKVAVVNPAAVLIQGPQSGTDSLSQNVNFIDNAIYVNATTQLMHGIQLYGPHQARVANNRIVGNASITSGSYGIDVFSAWDTLHNNMHRCTISENYIADFNNIAINVHAPAGSCHIDWFTCDGNEFEQFAATNMTVGLQLDDGASHVIQNAAVRGNRWLTAGQMLFGAYPPVPWLVGGNRLVGGDYQYTASPDSVLTENIGARCTDITAGRVYLKVSGSGNTGWRIQPAGTETIASGALAPLLRTSYITTSGTKAYTLADGNAALDGEIKRFVVTSATSTPAGTLTPTHLADGSSHTITWSGTCSFELMWDQTNTTWRVFGTPRNATVN